MYKVFIIIALFVPQLVFAQVVNVHQTTKTHFTGATTTSPIYWNATSPWIGDDVVIGSSTQFFVIQNTGFYHYCLFATLLSGTLQGQNNIFVRTWSNGTYNTELNLYASSTGVSTDRDSVYACRNSVFVAGDLIQVANSLVSGSSWGGGASVGGFEIYRISSSTSQTSSTASTSVIDNPAQNVFNGLVLFFIGMIFIVWFFRGNLIK